MAIRRQLRQDLAVEALVHAGTVARCGMAQVRFDLQWPSDEQHAARARNSLRQVEQMIARDALTPRSDVLARMITVECCERWVAAYATAVASDPIRPVKWLVLQPECRGVGAVSIRRYLAAAEGFGLVASRRVTGRQ